ncbi:hypothetical protein CNMCM7691_002653 [Aspergillus felis]|uniref:FHF complex subunit HOOK-interacting protein C-terminal domain-containing protein n=1 Tax=Aspergillus felis TaxID=1287682 RepID=A0A8H6VCA0_9EURO|nr:hypothetical protein CNMCM7691_002653 [Aspergillus felis]
MFCVGRFKSGKANPSVPLRQQIWRSTTTPSGNLSAGAQARIYIERLNSILGDESRGPAPHPCLAYAASSQIFVTITKVTLSSYDGGQVGTLRAAAIFFNTLIDSEVDGVVDNRLFARALVDLVRRADKHDEDVEGRLVELLFGVANNIRLQPSILPAWFAPRSDDQDKERQANTGTEFAGATRTNDFPLFYLLVQYVHHAGRAGDFARTGLLYLIETASRSKILERWLIESDLATLMATGLGALYSQLGSLSFGTTEEENLPEIVALSDHARHESALPPRLDSTMDSFMSYLLFWQDTIDHCKSAEVNGTLLDHFQVLFLEQLLYPSLLESSDVEGGSTAAVLTYLYRILESIEQHDLVHRILHFLLASPSDSEPMSKMDMSSSRRKSLDVLAAFSEGAARPSPSLFNLRDLALLGLQSTNRQTVLATLRLLTVVLQRHHSFARSLVRTDSGQPAKQRTVGALNAELAQLLGLATSIVHDPTLNDSFENYLKDASWILEARLSTLPAEDDFEDDRPLQLRKEDPILRELLNLLGTFFTNSVMVNLALTEVLKSIASSHLVSLDGWLLVDPMKYDFSAAPTTESDSTLEILEQIQLAYHEPSWSSADVPMLTCVLQRLVQQIQGWRRDISDFDILIAARRDLLHQGNDPRQSPSRSRQASVPPTGGSSEKPIARMAQVGADFGSPRGRAGRSLDVQSVASTPQRAAARSPARDPSVLSAATRESSMTRQSAAEELRKRLAEPLQVRPQPQRPRSDADEAEDVTEPAGGHTDRSEDAIVNDPSESATLGHVLTNTVILQWSAPAMAANAHDPLDREDAPFLASSPESSTSNRRTADRDDEAELKHVYSDNEDDDDDVDERSGAQTIERIRFRFMVTLFAMILAFEVGIVMAHGPMTRIYESIACRQYYAEYDPRQIAADGQVPESLCKIKEVQTELAAVKGYKEFFDGVLSAFLAIPYGLLADRIGRKPIICLSIPAFALNTGIMLAVMWYSDIFPLRAVWASCLAWLLGGGPVVAFAIIWTMMSDVTPADERAAMFFRFGVVSMGADFASSAVSSWMMTWDPWLPLLIGWGIVLAGVLCAITLPETMHVSSARRTERSASVELAHLASENGDQKGAIQKEERQMHPDDSDVDSGEGDQLPFTLRSAAKRPFLRRMYSRSRQYLTPYSFIFRNKQIVLLLTAFLVYRLSRGSSWFLVQYISTRYKWTLAEANLFTSFKPALSIPLFLFILPALSRHLLRSMHTSKKDLQLARLSIICLCLGTLGIGLSPSIAMLVPSLLVQTAGSGFLDLIRSLITTMVKQEETARLFTIIEILQAMGNVIASLSITTVFQLGLELGGSWIGLAWMMTSTAFALVGVAVWCVRLPPVVEGKREAEV